MGGGAQTHSTVPAPQLAAALLHKCTTSLDFSYLLLLLLLLLHKCTTPLDFSYLLLLLLLLLQDLPRVKFTIMIGGARPEDRRYQVR